MAQTSADMKLVAVTSYLEGTEVLGVGEESYQVYLSAPEIAERQDSLRVFVLGLATKTASKYGISKVQLWRMNARIKAGKSLGLRNKIQSRVANAYRTELNKQKI